MNFIDTREKLHKYIVETLGEPVITVEVTKTQLNNIIDNTINVASQYISDAMVVKNIILNMKPNIREYRLNKYTQDVNKVKSLGSTLGMGLISFDMGGGLVATQQEIITGLGNGKEFDISGYLAFKAKMSQINKFFTVQINYNWNAFNKTLTLLDDTPINSNKILISTNEMYVPNDCGDMIFDHPWIKDMTVAKAKLQWGTNIGKLDGAMLGGASLNYDRIIQEAKEDIERLNNELLTKWTPPPKIYTN